MAMKTAKVEVWAGSIEDQPGGLNRVLGALAGAGASVECVIARRQPDRPGEGVVFVTPVKGRKVQDAAKSAGLSRADDIATLRIEGPDQPGLGHRITQAVAEAGVNMRGLTAAVIGNRFVAYVGFDSESDASAAARVVKNAGTRGKTPRGAAGRARPAAKTAASRGRTGSRSRARTARR